MANNALLLLFLARARQRRVQHSYFRQQLSLEGTRRRHRIIPRVSLHTRQISAFAFLFGSGNDQALITLTGLDFSAFHYVLTGFEWLYEGYSPYSTDGQIRRFPQGIRKACRRSMDATQCLALLLSCGRTRGSSMVLCMLFGVTGSLCSLFLRFGRRLLLKMLASDTKARVTMPTAQKILSFQGAIGAKYSMLDNVYCVADGLKLHLEQAGSSVIQNMFYNGWTHDHYVGNVFVFAPSGIIIACAVNAPGAMHDSSIAYWGGGYRKLEDAFNSSGGRCVVDSAFSKGQFPFLIKSSQDPLMASNGDSLALTQLLQATAVRQASEWVMRALQGTYPRLKDRFVYEENGKRKVMLLTIFLLFNLRTRLVGLNQILTTFMPNLSSEANHFLINTVGL